MLQNLLQYFKIWPTKLSVESLVIFLQRVAGCLLLIALPMLMKFYHLATNNRFSFNQLYFLGATGWMHSINKTLLYISIVSVLYYAMASIREELSESKIISTSGSSHQSAVVILGFSLFMIFGVGYWLW